MSQEGRDEKGRFTVGNLFSKGLENSGRPPLYSDPNEIATKLAEYIEYEDAVKGTKNKGIYTIEGACLYLGFSTRQAMYEYENRNSEFNYVINRFKLFMTHWNAQKLYWGGTFSGSQFWLKNWGGYKDEVTQNQNQTITKVEPQIIKSDTPLADSE